jgi:hypothetical protein
LAIGALAYRAEHVRLELDALKAEAEREGGGEIHGVDLLERLAAAAEQRLAAVREHLPDDAPQDWVSLGSAVLFDEYERKVREVGAKLNPRVSPEMAPVLRRQFEAICVGGPHRSIRRPRRRSPGTRLTTPSSTRRFSPTRTLVSDDRDIVPAGDERIYEHGDHRVLAVRFGHFVREYFRPAELDWGAIDGTMLANCPLGPGASGQYRPG